MNLVVFVVNILADAMFFYAFSSLMSSKCTEPGCDQPAAGKFRENKCEKHATSFRANHYEVPSNMPETNPVKRVDFVDIEDLAGKEMVKICRCFKSKTFPFCDGSHNEHNKETGDNAGCVVIMTGSM